jgi:IMP dehydrogenase
LPANAKILQHGYGFDDVSIAPGEVTINPDMVDVSVDFSGVKLKTPIIASAMDAVVDTSFAVDIHKFGGLGVLNLDGIQCRFEDTNAIYKEIAACPLKKATSLMQKIYSEPIKTVLISKRVEEIKNKNATAAVSFVPQNAKRHAPLAVEAGADIVVVQGTVITARHTSRSLRGLILSELVKDLRVPIIVGNTVSYEVTKELMEQGIHGILVGVGPGSVCTSREVLGIGVPQITATLECAAGRDAYHKETGRYVPIVTDGGIRTGGDVCKSFAAGADAVMIGSPFAKCEEAPAYGFHWGMATWHPELPRGTRIKLNTEYTLNKLLNGPSSKTDGTLNLIGALKVCMGYVGATNLREMHSAKMYYAPAVKTEGKIYQMTGLSS